MSAVARPEVRPKRMLVAEDEPAANLLLTRLLQRQGFDVVTVTDGAQALARVSSEAFDVILLDWMLPALDGIEVARRVQSMKDPKPRVLMMSVLDIPAARAHASDVGAGGFLAKPIDPTRLVAAIASLDAPKADEPPDAETHSMARTEAWRGLGVMSAKAIADMSPEPVAEIEAPALGADQIAICAMTDATHGLELWATVSASPADAAGVASLILGEPSPSATDAQEILAELANIVAGVAKSKFAPEGFGLTLSVPTQATPAHLTASTAKAFARKRVGVKVGSATVVVGYYVRGASAIDLRLDQLEQGHVLAEDLKNANGGMLLPACACLTETTIKRIRANLPPSTRVRVCAPGG